VRRLVIFGRSNLIHDAPISHVHLLICRNVLIYFDPAAQRHIMNRLQYALEPGGVLFLGKSESQLRNSTYFYPLDLRWRVFQRTTAPSPIERPRYLSEKTSDTGYLRERAQQELELVQLYQKSVLEAMGAGIILVDSRNIVLNENDSALRLWGFETRMV